MRLEIRLPLWLLPVVGALLMHAVLAWWLYRSLADLPTLSSAPSVVPVRLLSSTETSGERPVVRLSKPMNEQTPNNPRAFSAWNSQTPKETIHRGSQRQRSSAIVEQQPIAPPQPATQGTSPLDMRNEPGKEGSEKDLSKVNLTPSKEILQRILASSQTPGEGSDDDIEDVTEGAVTALNSISFKYSTFFERIKREIKPRWHPAEIAAQYDPMGKMYGHKKRMTTLKVTLDKEGTVTNLEVVLESGFPELDVEAQQSFRRAESFPNPPKGLIKPNGLIQFRFSFILYWIGEQQRLFMRGLQD